MTERGKSWGGRWSKTQVTVQKDLAAGTQFSVYSQLVTNQWTPRCSPLLTQTHKKVSSNMIKENKARIKLEPFWPIYQQCVWSRKTLTLKRTSCLRWIMALETWRAKWIQSRKSEEKACIVGPSCRTMIPRIPWCPPKLVFSRRPGSVKWLLPLTDMNSIHNLWWALKKVVAAHKTQEYKWTWGHCSWKMD